ncbi:hypothetical protein D3C85_764170 [compost metagenome]
MSLARNHAGLRAVEPLDLQVDIANVGAQGAHHEIEPASANHLDQHLRLATGDMQLHLWKSAGKTAEDRHQARRQRLHGDTQCDLPFGQAIPLSDVLNRAIAIQNDRARPGQENLAGQGHADALIGAHEQGDAQFLFQTLNRLCQRALRNVQLSRCRTETAHVDHRAEGAQLDQLHDARPLGRL